MFKFLKDKINKLDSDMFTAKLVDLSEKLIDNTKKLYEEEVNSDNSPQAILRSLSLLNRNSLILAQLIALITNRINDIRRSNKKTLRRQSALELKTSNIVSRRVELLQNFDSIINIDTVLDDEVTEYLIENRRIGCEAYKSQRLVCEYLISEFLILTQKTSN